MKWTEPGSRIKGSSLVLLLYLLAGPGLLHARSSGQLEVGMFSLASPGEGLPAWLAAADLQPHKTTY